MTDPITRPLKEAGMTVNAFQNNQRAYWQKKANGLAAIPAMGNMSEQPAVSAASYLAALGADNIAALDAAYGVAPTA